MPDLALQINPIGVDEERNIKVSFSGKLDAGELLTGTPTVTEVDTSHFTISNEQVNTAILSINGVDVPIGEGVQFKAVPGGSVTKGKTYSFKISVDTDDGQVLTGQVTAVTK